MYNTRIYHFNNGNIIAENTRQSKKNFCDFRRALSALFLALSKKTQKIKKICKNTCIIFYNLLSYPSVTAKRYALKQEVAPLPRLQKAAMAGKFLPSMSDFKPGDFSKRTSTAGGICPMPDVSERENEWMIRPVPQGGLAGYFYATQRNTRMRG